MNSSLVRGLAGVVLILLAGCERPEQAQEAPPASPPASGHVQEPPPALQQVLDPLAPSDAQRAQVRHVMQSAAQDWQAWLEEHWSEAAELQGAMQDAAAGDEAEKAEQFRQRWVEVIRGAPQPAHAWERVKALFPPSRQSELRSLRTDAYAAMNRELHASVLNAEAGIPAEPGGRCIACHAPR